jgi:Ala-tRNA(Pro) deacylase
VATADLTRMLDEAGVREELLPHARSESALAEADALGIAPAEVAKTLVVTTAEGYLRAVLSAAARIDLRKLREARGGGKKKVHLASEEALARDYPEFELGAIPPIGGARRDPVVVDRTLAERDSVVLEAGSHEQSVRIPTGDLLRVTGAQVADICVGEEL